MKGGKGCKMAVNRSRKGADLGLWRRDGVGDKSQCGTSRIYRCMTQPDVRKWLEDIRTAARLIQRFVEGKSLADHQADAMLRSAVERQFEIVGEALNQALRSDPAVGEMVSHARRIVNFRNLLAHGYASVADDVVWGIVEGDLEVPLAEVERLLK